MCSSRALHALRCFLSPSTQKYVMWFHCDTPGFTMRSVGVLTADAVTGPYEFASPCFRPDGRDSYDMGTFLDATGDGRSYLIRSVENKFAGISQVRLVGRWLARCGGPQVLRFVCR